MEIEIIEITSIKPFPANETINFCLDSPSPEHCFGSFFFPLAGWLVSQKPVKFLELLDVTLDTNQRNARLLARFPLNMEREDVLQHISLLYPDKDIASQNTKVSRVGFALDIDIYPSLPIHRLILRACLQDNTTESLCEIIISSKHYLPSIDTIVTEQLYHLHIPKTAGSWLRDQLSYCFTPQETLFIYEGLLCSMDDLFVGMATKKAFNESRLVFGHIPYGWHRHAPPHIKYSYSTVLRKPEDYFISYIKHQLRSNPDIKKEHIHDFITMQLMNKDNSFPLCNNPYTRMISGVDGAMRSPYSIEADLLYDIALKNIETEFSVIGVMENLDGFITQLSKFFGKEFSINKQLINAAPINGEYDETIDQYMKDEVIRTLFDEAFKYDNYIYHIVTERNQY